jgi:hypothetical protein
MVRLGFYFVHQISLPAARLVLQSYIRRETMTRYPLFARYQLLERDGLFYVLNARGHLIILQPIPNVDNLENALRSYRDPIIFNEASLVAASGARNLLDIRFDDFDTSFPAHIGAEALQVKWNFVSLPVPTNEPWHVQIFIEALFVFSLCKSSESCLMDLLSGTSTRYRIRNLLEYARDLIAVEKPDHFLVNSSEIKLITPFYDAWGLDKYVRSLQSRFSQAIDTFNIHFNEIQASRAVSLNRFVAAVTVLALLQVADTLAMPNYGISAEYVKTAILLCAGAFIGMGLALNFRRNASELAWRWRNEWPLQRRLTWLSKHRGSATAEQRNIDSGESV